MNTLTEAQVSKLLKEREENSALPFLVFSGQGNLVLSNDRGRKLLGLGDKKYPLPREELLKSWNFYNEEMAGPAILTRILMGVANGKKLLAQLNLKTYRIWSLADLVPGHVVMLCELVRKGDLMEDKESRQHLFRVLAHEIRTSSQILGSYVEMVRAKDEGLAKRMDEGVKRLERAVALLQELKSELELK